MCSSDLLVSGERLPGLLADSYLADTIERQVAAADLLLVSHCAELDEPALTQVGERLRAINLTATQLRAEQGDVPIEIVLEPEVLRAAGADDAPTDLANAHADAANAKASDDESSCQRPTTLRARSLRPAGLRTASANARAAVAASGHCASASSAAKRSAVSASAVAARTVSSAAGEGTPAITRSSAARNAGSCAAL